MRSGEPYSHDSYGATIFGAAVRASGLPSGTTTHALRHHFASVLLAADESVGAVAERLGHQNATLALKTYRHVMQDGEARTRRAIDQACSRDKAVTSSSDVEPRPAAIRGL